MRPTNLVLKGIIGVKSMAEMSRALGEQADAQLYDARLSAPLYRTLYSYALYQGQANAMAASWHSLALSSDGSHFLEAFGDEKSWALMYNMYADRLLDTGIVNQTVSTAGTSTQFYALIAAQILQSQTAFYKNLLSSKSCKSALCKHHLAG